MRKHNVNVIASGLPASISDESFNLRKGRQRGYEYIPAYDSANTAGFHGVEMVHDCGVDGLNLCARDSGRALAWHFGIIRVLMTIRHHKIIA